VLRGKRPRAELGPRPRDSWSCVSRSGACLEHCPVSSSASPPSFWHRWLQRAADPAAGSTRKSAGKKTVFTFFYLFSTIAKRTTMLELCCRAFSPVVGIGPPPPPQTPHPFLGEGNTRWRKRGWESPNSDEGTYTVVLYSVYISALCVEVRIFVTAY
jgi:hypothetical protein